MPCATEASPMTLVSLRGEIKSEHINTLHSYVQWLLRANSLTAALADYNTTSLLCLTICVFQQLTCSWFVPATPDVGRLSRNSVRCF
jgi:hypothetical protein